MGVEQDMNDCQMGLQFGFGLGGPSPSHFLCSSRFPLMGPVGLVVVVSCELSRCLPCHPAHHYEEGLLTCLQAAVVDAVVVAVVAAVGVGVVAAVTTVVAAGSFLVDLAGIAEYYTHLGLLMAREARADLSAENLSRRGMEERRGLEEG